MANMPSLLRAAGNGIRQELAASLTNSGLSVTIDDATDLNSAGGLIEIDYDNIAKRERVYYLSKSGNVLTIADDGRGLFGTTAVAHDAGALVRGFFVDEHINGLVDMFEVGHEDNGSHKSDLRGGWRKVSEDWEFGSVDDPTGVITVPSGATSRFSEGMRIKFVNGSNSIFGIITGVTSTTITFLHQINSSTNQAVNLMQDSAITDAYYSPEKAPLGFPLSPTTWGLWKTDNQFRSQSTPTNGVWYNPGSISLTLPPGRWGVKYGGLLFGNEPDAVTDLSMSATLSNTDNTEMNTWWTSHYIHKAASAAQYIFLPVFKEGVIEVSNKTTYYLNVKTIHGGYNSIGFAGDTQVTFIQAILDLL